MIERIGTMREIGQVEDKLPEDVLRDLIHFITILDGEYGEYRKYDVYFPRNPWEIRCIRIYKRLNSAILMILELLLMYQKKSLF